MNSEFQLMSQQELYEIEGGGVGTALALAAGIALAVTCPVAAGAVLVLGGSAAIGTAAGIAITGWTAGVMSAKYIDGQS